MQNPMAEKLEQAHLLLKQLSYQAALELFDKIVVAEPHNYEALAGKIVAMILLKQKAEAETIFYEKFVNLKEKTPTVYLHMANIFAWLNKVYEVNMVYIEAKRNKYWDDVENEKKILEARIHVYWRQKFYKKAFILSEGLLKIFPQDPSALTMKIVNFYYNGKYKEAKEATLVLAKLDHCYDVCLWVCYRLEELGRFIELEMHAMNSQVVFIDDDVYRNKFVEFQKFALRKMGNLQKLELKNPKLEESEIFDDYQSSDDVKAAMGMRH